MLCFMSLDGRNQECFMPSVILLLAGSGPEGRLELRPTFIVKKKSTGNIKVYVLPPLFAWSL